MLALKNILFTIIAPGSVTVLIPYWLLSRAADSDHFGFGWVRFAGILPIIVGAGLYLRCIWGFGSEGKGTPAPIDPPKHLVVRGPYRFVRNPMYLGIYLILAGEGVLFESRSLLVLLLVFFTASFLFVLLYEEPALLRKFGESYEEYRRTVPRWIPYWKKRGGVPQP